MADLNKFRQLAHNWEALGETDPMFGVLSDPTNYGGKWPTSKFFAPGVAYVQKLMRTRVDNGRLFAVLEGVAGAAQTHVDTSLGEAATPSYTLANLTGGVRRGPLALTVGIVTTARHFAPSKRCPSGHNGG